MELITPKGRFWIISDYVGDWQLAEKNDNYWYIVNTRTKASKRIGKARMRGTNYCDKAREEAIRRNAQAVLDHMSGSLGVQ